jgi:hypothetical protein
VPALGVLDERDWAGWLGVGFGGTAVAADAAVVEEVFGLLILVVVLFLPKAGYPLWLALYVAGFLQDVWIQLERRGKMTDGM